jgi:outer membrane autotransporter protein
LAASGSDSDAIRAEAFGGDVAVKIDGGRVVGGSGSAAGVHLIGGGNNNLTNSGTIMAANGLAGTAVLGETIPAGIISVTTATPAGILQNLTLSNPTPVIGNNTINNAGLIVGNVDLGPGANTFNNHTGATLNPGAMVKLGAGNTLNNSGDLSPGGKGVIQTTTLTGNLVQTSSGKLTVDVDPAAGRADRINVSGTARLAGQAVVNPINTSTPSAAPLTILHADGGVTNAGVTLVEPATVTYQLKFPDPNDVALQTAVDFAPFGLNRNQTAIGQNFNAIQAAGIPPALLSVTQALISLPDVQSLGQAYDQLSPETYADDEIAQYFAGLHFADSMMSCSVPDGRYAFISEGQCMWARVGGRFLNLNPTAQNLGFSETAFQLTGGAELTLQPDWFAEFALGYDRANEATSDSLATSHGDRLHAGGAIKYNPGPLLLSAAIYGGYGWYDTSRQMNFDNFGALAQSNSTIRHIGGQLRASYLLDQGSWYVKPLIDLDLTHIALNGFSEHGAVGANLIVSGTDNTLFTGSPAVEIGTQMEMPDGNFLRPFARAGLTAFNNTNFGVSAMFAGAPAGVASFRVATGIDAVLGDVSVGANLLSRDGWSLKLSYDGHYGSRFRDSGFQLKASIRF